jgi:hypothetical protein
MKRPACGSRFVPIPESLFLGLNQALKHVVIDRLLVEEKC